MPPPLSTSPLFPYTTLFRSAENGATSWVIALNKRGHPTSPPRPEEPHDRGAPPGSSGGSSGPDTAGAARFRRTDAALLLPFAADRKSTRLNSSHPSISYAVF